MNLNCTLLKITNNAKYNVYFLFFFLLYSNMQCCAQTFDNGELINGPGFGFGQVKTFDADRDGDLDLLAFPYLYFNDGHGKKQKMVIIGDSKKEHEHYSIEDIDGDKDLDIVVLYKSAEIAIFINSPKGFSKKEQKNKITYSPSEYAKLYLYDANSDGVCDIIISGLRGVPVAYTGNKTQQFSYFKPFNDNFRDLNFVLGIDINKDKIQELLVPSYSNKNEEKRSLKIYSFKGNKYVLIDTIVLTTSGMDNIKLMDMDKDGDLDLVYSESYRNPGIYWLERNSKGGFGKTHTLISSLELQNFQLEDFDSDGDLDIAYFTQQNQYTFINWAENKGSNVFIKNQKSLLPNSSESKSFFFEDFDGDKIKDVLFYDDDKEQIRPRYTMVLQQKDGKVKDKNNWVVKSDCSGFLFTDLNNNGTKDIVGYYNNELFYTLIDSKGKYSETLELARSPFKIKNLKCADIDNDGKDDLVLCSDDSENGKLGWFKNEGNIKFNHFTVIHDERQRLINYEIIDYDHDGNKDLAVNYWTDEIRGFYIYKNNGNGVFNKTRTIVTETKDSYPNIALWDVDGNKKDDLVDLSSKTWFNYLGSEKWEKKTSPFEDQFIKDIYKAKVDDNNSSDCIMLSSGNPKWLKYNNGQWQSKIIPVDFGIDMIKVGDINGDGYDDIICMANKYDLAEGFNQDLAFSYKYSIICLLNDKSGNFTSKTLCPVPDLNSIELQDIDNDGDLDVLASVKWGKAGIEVWKNLRNN
ncbi:FG-GAP repeat domain-containing protein [Flavobacterium poyangense]|uniref:FG-GAP repeat domain-containing protein n=1 Tax=Flavobacterium poyangense TaxID=2204302 RepID=UPI00141E438F|nr:VCBS repeat-containing protein [Flavobacterium sp. JXAS1]